MYATQTGCKHSVTYVYQPIFSKIKVHQNLDIPLSYLCGLRLNSMFIFLYVLEVKYSLCRS